MSLGRGSIYEQKNISKQTFLENLTLFLTQCSATLTFVSEVKSKIYLSYINNGKDKTTSNLSILLDMAHFFVFRKKYLKQILSGILLTTI